MGNKIENTKKKAKLSSSELRKKKKERMARYVVTSVNFIYPSMLIHSIDGREVRRSSLMMND